MRTHIVLRYAGLALLLNSAFMFISVLVSIIYGVDTGFYPLLLSFFLTAILGLFPFIFVTEDVEVRNKESYAIVVGSWGLSCLAGMLPYILWGGEFTFVNALFESVSGYTTTGSTVLQDVEALPNSLLFWRSCTHLLGGAGIIIFALAIIPTLGKAKVSLSSVELSSLAKDNYKYRIHKIVRIVLVVYAFLITSEVICLRVAGMDWFDAINHSFSTIATGGFSTKNQSIAYYNNVWIEGVITFFMILAGCHFGLLFSSITSKRNNIFRSEVSRFYLLTILYMSIVVIVNLWTTGMYDLYSSARYAIFQVVAVITTTGFATVDTALWPPLAVLILLFLMYQCACAGSTTGGLKSDRVLILFKSFKARVLQMQHPNAIVRVKMNNITLDQAVVSGVQVFVALYIVVTVAGTLILTAMGVDLITSFSAIVSCMGNVGPGFGGVSSLGNYAMLPAAAKVVCSVAMMMGRLELFGFLQLFLIKTWK